MMKPEASPVILSRWRIKRGWMSRSTFTHWRPTLSRLVLVTLLLADAWPSVARGQDSIAMAMKRYEAHRAAAAACARFPLVLDAHGPAGDSQLHRDPATGRDCWVLPGPLGPVAYRVDDILYCPSSEPSTWQTWPARARVLAAGEIRATEVTRDSAVLRRLQCRIAPVALLRLTTTRAVRTKPRHDNPGRHLTHVGADSAIKEATAGGRLRRTSPTGARARGRLY